MNKYGIFQIYNVSRCRFMQDDEGQMSLVDENVPNRKTFSDVRGSGGEEGEA